jgi:short-subunit dehydrogenase
MIIPKEIVYIILILALIGFLLLLKVIVYRIVPFVEQYAIIKEQNLSHRYGAGSWVLITGPSSGMGERFAHEFAQRGFNLLLVGSKRTKSVIRAIKKVYKSIEIKFVEVDFANSFNESFFDPIQKQVDELGNKWRVLINNVGYRTACFDYRDMSVSEMKKTIAVGTLVQSKLIQMGLKAFSQIDSYTAIVNITAQNSVCTDLFAVSNDITVPHLACYEASNAYGYFHAKSVYEEIKNKFPKIDFLIIMPGAVVTKNTESVLKDTTFSIDVDTFVKNIIKLMGNKNGPYCAYWGHSFSGALLNIFPFVNKDEIMKKVGTDFALDKSDKSDKSDKNIIKLGT